MQVSSFLKKAFATFGVTLLLLNSAQAKCDQSPSIQKNKEKEKREPVPFAFSYSKDMSLQKPIDFHFYGDFIVMQAQEDGLDYAILDALVQQRVVDSFPANDTLPINNGAVQGFSTGQQSWSWDLGFRIGVGGILPHADWNLDLNWLSFAISEEVSESVKSLGGFIPLWSLNMYNVPDPSHESCSARWHVKVNTVDSTMSKPYYVSRYFVLNPFWGLRGASIQQNYTARYSGIFGDVVEIGANGPVKTQATNNFWGLGPRIGFSSEWLLAVSNLKFINSLSFSALAGSFYLNQQVPSYATSEYHSNFRTIAMNMDLQLGLGWGIHFNEDRHFFSLTAMYEYQQWWDQNQMRITQTKDPVVGVNTTISSDVVSRGDLRLNGFLFRFQFDF